MHVNHILILIWLGLVTWNDAHSQSSFSEQLVENQLEFTMPQNFVEVPVKENPDLYYNYAIKHKKAALEVRYSIFSLKEMLIDYENSLSDSTRVMIDPNKLYKSMILVNILNISQLRLGSDPLPQIADFPAEAVKEEFGCEYGGTAFFEVNSTFSAGYNYCSIVYLHKENIADVCICFLVKKPKEFEKYFHLAFHALRFSSM